ncbi:MAG: tRNA (N(6)-L-threonylcarbamoyladenosine(37)-C(2))-methylthiotransferase MtaB [Deltaproteobacteria bacterium]|nr:tRNA (N(6)-L-threonylcarbamoyladenosine(37)-C(2))-methylthiotransferase MtaB [Deltaproteobacteria bacterium]
MSSTVYLAAVGCRVNQAEIDGLAAELVGRGFVAVADPTRADLVVLNTCAVTGSADTDGRKLVRRIHRSNPNARIVVTGCQAERDAEKLAALPGVRLVAGNGAKARVAELAVSLELDRNARIERPPVVSDERFVALAFEPELASSSRPLVKIQDGCDRSCAFCVIPGARGGSRSLGAESVIDRLRAIARAGHAEAVLTGIDLGSWGADLDPASSLALLLDRIDRERPLQRLRLSSLDPRDLTEELAERLARYSWICPHLHVSLQTGSAEVHRRMGRGRWPHGIEERLRLICRARAGLSLGLDVLTGFPGETERDHERTLTWVRDQPVTYLHVFPYSPRPGTAAFEWPMANGVSFVSPVAQQTLRRRARELRELGARLRLAFHQRHVGREVECVLERIDGDLARGSSANFVPLEWRLSERDRVGALTRVRIVRARAEACEGVVA